MKFLNNLLNFSKFSKFQNLVNGKKMFYPAYSLFGLISGYLIVYMNRDEYFKKKFRRIL